MLKTALVRAAAWATATVVMVSHLEVMAKHVGGMPMPPEVTDTLSLAGKHDWSFAALFIWTFLRNCVYYGWREIELHRWSSAFQGFLLVAVLIDGVRLLRKIRLLPGALRALHGELREDLRVIILKFVNIVERSAEAAAAIPRLPRKWREARAARRRRALSDHGPDKQPRPRRGRPVVRARQAEPRKVRADARDAGGAVKRQAVALDPSVDPIREAPGGDANGRAQDPASSHEPPMP